MYIRKDFTEVQKGVFERNEKGQNVDVVINEHYDNAALAILKSDKVHYSDMLPSIVEQMPEIIGRYQNAIAIGGGSPKFETQILLCNNIKVIDMNAHLYKEHDNDFREIFGVGENIEISYTKKFLEKPYKVSKKERTVVTFVHILEHRQSFEDICKWLELQDNDVIIYGPNIESAKDDNWVHYSPAAVDHNVFFTVEAITEKAKEYGYTVKSLTYSDDMLVWLTKTDDSEAYRTLMEQP